MIGGKSSRPVIEIRISRSIVPCGTVYHQSPDIMNAADAVYITAVAQCILDPKGREVGFCKNCLSGSQVMVQMSMGIGVAGYLVSHSRTGQGICRTDHVAVFVCDENIGIRFRERIGADGSLHDKRAVLSCGPVQLQTGPGSRQILAGGIGTERKCVLAFLLQLPSYGVCQSRVSLHPGAVSRQIIAVLIIEDVFSQSGCLKEKPCCASAVCTVRHVSSVPDGHILSR